MNKFDFLNSLNCFQNNGLSIIITAYKSQEFIEECLDSIQSQTYFKYHNNYEILLGIDACELTLKKVKKIRKKYKNIKVFYASENGGTYRMRNSLWLESKYENILFFDSDDIMPCNFISNNIRYTGLYDLIRYRIRFFKNGKIRDNKCRESNWFVVGSILTKKNVLKNIGGFSDERISMDMELVKRLEKKGIKEFLNKNTYYWYREHGGQLTVSKETSLKSKKRKIVNEKIFKRLLGSNLINDSIACNGSLQEIIFD